VWPRDKWKVVSLHAFGVTSGNHAPAWNILYKGERDHCERFFHHYYDVLASERDMHVEGKWEDCVDSLVRIPSWTKYLGWGIEGE